MTQILFGVAFLLAQVSLAAQVVPVNSIGFQAQPYSENFSESGTASLRLGASSAAFLSSSSEKIRSGQNELHLLSADFLAEGRSSLFLGKLEGGAGFLVASRSKTDGYWNVSEAYFGVFVAEDRSAEILFGRARKPWSALDDAWALGLTQPRLRWDYFQPQIDGLTGFFLEKRLSSARFNVFASPFFVPEISGGLQFDDGRILSKNPYSSPPQSSTEIFGQPTELRYALAKPDVKDVLLNPSGGARVEIGEVRGFWGSLSYLYAPIEQFELGYSGNLNLVTDHVDVTVSPKVRYHHVGGVDLGFRGSIVSSELSTVFERVEVGSQFAPGWTSQKFDSVVALSPLFRADFSSLLHHEVSASGGFLYRFDGQTNDFGPLAPEKGSVFEPRLLFTRAAKLGLSARLPGVFYQVRASGGLMYELSEAVSMTTAMLEFFPGKRISVDLRADFLSALGDASSDSERSIRPLIAHDRVQARLVYAF